MMSFKPFARRPAQLKRTTQTAFVRGEGEKFDDVIHLETNNEEFDVDQFQGVVELIADPGSNALGGEVGVRRNKRVGVWFRAGIRSGFGREPR